MAKFLRITVVAVIVSCATAFVSACGVSGTALPSSPVVDVSQLDPGPYSTSVHIPPESSLSAEERTVREAQRMANYLVDPFELNVTLTGKLDPTGILYRVRDVAEYETSGFSTDGLEALTRAAAENNFAGGAWVSRGDGKRNGLQISNALLRFPDSESAARASAAMETAVRDWNNSPRIAFVHKVPAADISIPGYPDGHAYHTESDYGLVSAWFATGPIVVHSTVVDSGKDAAAIASVAAGVIGKQVDLLRTFVPTPLDQLSSLMIDKEDILTRALPFKKGDSVSPAQQAYYLPRGILHFSEDAAVFQKLMVDAGVDLAGYNASVIFRTKDQVSAWRMQSAWMKAHRKGYTELKPPSGSPEIECVKKKAEPNESAIRAADGRFQCAIAYGRYMAEVASDQQLDLNQKAAAQLALLVKNP
ncbi:hypothetical protein NOVA_07480 [Nocardia nova]|jgi:hypothetical protein|uniref:DUF7373 family lipoprotein n=1 Tax=Nocardia nova TaxID=37330 RepID=UPI001C4714D7|nr:hypothetical protein [Nocardia nova]MBV7702608.1 hypothetical protein [Nocardia nova]